jgi:hypothetical protein
MSTSARSPRRALTLVELVLVLGAAGLVFLITPALALHGVRGLVLLPRMAAANHAAAQILDQALEGGFSTLPGQAAPVRGLRFAARGSATEPSIWLAEASRVGFRTADGQSVLLRFDGSAVRRGLPAPACSPAPPAEEVLPYDAPGVVQIATTGSFFRYYNQSGTEVTPGCTVGGTSAVRRVDIAFTARTGTGQWEDGHVSEPVAASVAVRVP